MRTTLFTITVLTADVQCEMGKTRKAGVFPAFLLYIADFIKELPKWAYFAF